MKISVIAHPNSKRPRIVYDAANNLHVYVRERPTDGKANDAVIAALAKHFQVNRGSVLLRSGQKSKHKLFEVMT